MDDDLSIPPSQKVGRFRVATDAAKVEGFASAIALAGVLQPARGHVPTTFPACWLTQPEIRQALADAVTAYGAGANTILVHLSQSVDYRQPLRLDQGYWVDLELKPTGERRLRLEASIIDDDGVTVAELVGGFHMADLKVAVS